MYSALIRYARAECFQLTDTMYRKLPAELRNYVYQYLCVDDQSIPVAPYYHSRKYDQSNQEHEIQAIQLMMAGAAATSVFKDFDVELEADDLGQADDFIILPDGRVKYDHSEKPPSGTLLPNSHIFNWRYVGITVALEAEKFYYANNTFSICNVRGAIHHFLHGLSDMTARRTLEKAFKPLNLVRNLQIRIKYEHYGFHMRSLLRHPTPAEGYAAERNFLRNLICELEILQQLPQQPRKLQIEFIIMTAFEDFDQEDQERRCINLLEATRNVIYRIKHDKDSIVKISHYDPKVSVFPRDITGLWSLTKEQWEHVST
jgi:hypothetical protein